MGGGINSDLARKLGNLKGLWSKFHMSWASSHRQKSKLSRAEMYAKSSMSISKPVGQMFGGECHEPGPENTNMGVTEAQARKAQARFQKSEA